jgi:hypothetical protein
VSEDSACRSRAGEAAKRQDPRQAGRPLRPVKRAAARPNRHAPPSLAELQALFQRAVIEADDSILDLIADSSMETRDVLFGVYRHAYVARLVEVLRNDYERLSVVAGEAAFERLARDFIAVHPSHTPNARWFGQAFPEFLARHASAPTAWAELASLERALNDAFDAADGTRLTLADLALVPPAMWGGLIFTPHPALSRLDVTTNALELWRAAREDDGAALPVPAQLGEPARIAVYRPELTPRFRQLSYEEAMMLDEMVNGVAFAGLCEMVGTYGGTEDAALRAATHLKVWIEEGMLSGPQRL